MPLEPSAQELWNRAQEMRGERALDPLHFWVAVVPPDGTQNTPGTLLPLSTILQPYIKEEVRQQLIGHINIELIAPKHPSADGIAEKLCHYEFWSQEVTEHTADKVRITAGFMLWFILERVDTVARIMGLCNIDVEGIKNALKSRFDEPAEERESEDHARREDTVPAAYKEAMHLLRELKPTPDHRYKSWHSIRAPHLLDALAENVGAPRPKIVILTGQNGSPVDKIVEVLVDRLAAKHFSSEQKPLEQYSKVYLLDLLDLTALARLPSKPAPEQVLEVATQYVGKLKAILLLDHIEVLARHVKLEGQLRAVLNDQRAVLNDQDEGLILGRYIHDEELGNEAVKAFVSSLRLSHHHHVEIRPLIKEETLAFINKHYKPDWEKQGYFFEQGAFDLIFALERGAEVDDQHKTFPYLAVELGAATVETAAGGQDDIQSRALEARLALGKLRKEERTQITDEEAQFYEGPLQSAMTEITSLSENPKPGTNTDGKKILTRAHVTAEFLSENKFEFHYPSLRAKKHHKGKETS